MYSILCMEGVIQKPRVRIRSKNGVPSEPVLSVQPSNSSNSIARKVGALKKAAETAENIEFLRKRLMNILQDNAQKLQKRALAKLTKDITEAKRLVKLQNINKDYLEPLRGIRRKARIALTQVITLSNEVNEGKQRSEKASASKIQRLMRSRVTFEVLSNGDVETTAFEGMIRQVKLKVKLLGRDVEMNLPLILTSGYRRATQEVELDTQFRFFGKVHANTSKGGDDRNVGYDVGTFKQDEVQDWVTATQSRLKGNIQSNATVSMKSSILTFGFIKIPAGGHYIEAIDLLDVTSRKTVKAVKNKDNNCLWHALLISRCLGDRTNRVEKCEEPGVKAKARDLCNQCNFEFDKMVSVEDLHSIEEALDENIYVLNMRDLPIKNTDITVRNHLLYGYNTKNRNTKAHWLLLDQVNEHYYVISDIRKFFSARHFCDKCFRCIKCENTYNKHIESLCDSFADTTIQPVDNGKQIAKDCGRYMRGDTLHGSDEQIEERNNNTKRSKEEIEDEIKHPTYIIFDFETDTNQKLDEAGDRFLHTPNHAEVSIVKVADSHSYADSLIDTHSFPGYGCLDKFCKWLFTPENRGSTVMAHNGAGYDYKFILKWGIEHGLEPQRKIMQGSRITYMTYKKFNIRFVDPLNFFNTPLAKLPEMFGLEDIVKGDFPHKFNTPENQDYIGRIPAIEYYGVGNNNVKNAMKFEGWYAEQQGTTNWNFKEEMKKYCLADVEILARAVLSFRQLFYGKLNVDPFKYVTLPSLCMQLYKSKFMPDKTIASNDANKPISKVSREWFIYLNDKCIKRERVLKIDISKLPAFNRHAGKVLRVLRGENVEPDDEYKNSCVFHPDGIDENNKTIYEFQGCIYHGCPKCHVHAIKQFQ